jgi:PAS domain S-box-containing protein
VPAERGDEATGRYVSFFQLSSEAMCIADPFGCFRHVNPAFLAMTGYSEEELTSRPFLDFVLAEDRQRTADEMALQVSKRASLEFENRYVCKDGSTIVLLWNAYFDKTDGVTYAIARDVTKRRRAQGAIAQLAAIVESSNDGILMVGPDLSVLSWNDAAERLYGWTAGEAVGRPLRELVSVPAELQGAQGNILARAFAGEGTEGYDTIRFGRDGRRVDVSLTVFPVRDKAGAVVAVSGIHRDISERKRAEEALRQGEARFRTVVETIPVAIRIYHGERIVLANQANSVLTGYSPEEVLAPGFLQRVVHPEELPGLESREERRRRNKPVNRHFDCRIVRKDGEVRWAENDVVEIMFDGRPATLSVSIDVTERKLAEEAMRESRALLEGIMDGTTDAIYVKDLQGVYVMANAATEEVVGKSVEEILGKDDHSLFPAAEARAVMDGDRRTMESGSTRTYEEEATGADGQRRTYLATKGPVFDTGGKVVGMFGVSRDITERKLMEAALLQSQKFESLGELAGGLAHDFNNLFTVILGNSALAADGLTGESPKREAINEIDRAVVRGAQLARLLLDASGGEDLARKRVDLSGLGQVTVGLLMPSLAGGVAIECELAPDLPMIHVDASQVQRVLSGLVVNAAEALGVDGGRIVLATGVTHIGGGVSDSRFLGAGLKAGKYVYADVIDDGPGIAPDVLPKVFDPFFTTKFSGRGLGLSAAQGIARAHGGAIGVASVPGQGTAFRVLLPVAAETDNSV